MASEFDERFRAAIDRIDAANADDLHRVSHDGREIAAEVLYAQRMTTWLERLHPDASEPLRLAVRAQHIRRWEIPRETYPMDRAGYHRWRTALYTFHADTAERILRELGYDDATIARVRSLLRKERLKSDPETQALEDVACLVFLENYFAEFAVKHDDDKLITILRRTWAKMSPKAHEAALALPMQPNTKALIDRALSGES
jgi:hypothetical protein